MGSLCCLLALSVVRGFSREIEAKIIGFGAHVQVEHMRYAPLQDAEAIMTQIGDLEGIVDMQPVVSEFALLRRSRSEIEGVGLWGTNMLPHYLRGTLTEGTAELVSDDGKPRLVIGASLAQRLGTAVGDTLVMFSTRSSTAARQPSLVARPRIQQFRVGGVFESSLADFDETYVFTDIDIARTLLSYRPDEVTRVDVTLHDPSQAEATARAIEEQLGIPVLARSIYEVYRGLFAWVQLQEAIIPLVIGVLILVAAFNIVGTLLMVIMEKMREIGIFASMGASRQSLKRLFLSLGFWIGVSGTTIGLTLALVLALLQQHYGVIPLPADAYYMTTAPIALNAFDFVLVATVAMLLTALAAYIPARVAAGIDPLKVIRFS